jgi:molybdate transport system substrate-binding protein
LRGRTHVGLAGLVLTAATALGSPDRALAHAESASGVEPRSEATVFAAASLADALSEIGRSFQTETGIKVSFNFGATSDLGRQIRAGAPADVFFSADEPQMDLVEQAGLVRHADRVDLLSNTLVVIVPAPAAGAAAGAAARPALAGAQDIASFPRLALADPQAVPAGVYARAYLQSVGLWDTMAGRVVPTLNVRAAVAAVESENVPAAIVYRTDAIASRRVRIVLEVARDAGPRIVYVAAPLAAAGEPGRRFAAALATTSAARVFERLGFIVLPRHP